MTVIVNSKTGCPFCELAKEHLTNNGIKFKERLFDTDERQSLYDSLGLIGSKRTVPQIVVENTDGTIYTRIGGYVDLINSDFVPRYLSDTL